MLNQYFYISKYDWEVYIFYNVESINSVEIYDILSRFNYNAIIKDINNIISIINCGYCYTNYKDKRSILIINKAYNVEQMCNTIVHELNHLGSHIEEYYNINPHEEEASHLMGELAQKVFHFLNYTYT